MKPYYEDSAVQIFHGDCREILPSIEADVLVTDPPYGISWTAKKGRYSGRGSQVSVRDAVLGDRDTAVRDAILEIWGDSPAVIFGTWRVPRPSNTRHRLIWHKKGQGPGPANTAFMSQDEEIYILGEGFRRSSPPCDRSSQRLRPAALKWRGLATLPRSQSA